MDTWIDGADQRATPLDALARLRGTRGVVIEDTAYGVGLARVLTGWGAQVTPLGLALPALQQVVAQDALEWAILDLALTRPVTGVDLARWLRAHAPSVIRVAHSGQLRSVYATITAADAAAAGPLFHAVVPKPAPLTALVDALAIWLPVAPRPQEGSHAD